MSSAAANAAAVLARVSGRTFRAFIGFDGFIDALSTAVAQRGSMAADDYGSFAGISAFAARVAHAAGKSANIELVVHEERFGGNGPLLAGGMAALGVATTYVGCVGGDKDPGVVHPTFAPFAARCERVVPLAKPSRTECLEFADGKVMFNKVFTRGDAAGSMQGVRWEHVVSACGGLEALRNSVAGCSLVGVVNWSIMAGVEDIWAGLARDVLPHIPAAAPDAPTPRRVLVDISDPAKRTRDDIRRAMAAVAQVHVSCPVTLGLNLSEAEQVCGALLGDEVAESMATQPLAQRCRALAAHVRGAVNVECVVVHPREGAAGVRAHGEGVESAWVEGPFTETPKLSTGAGDHFNAGLGLALMLDLPLDQSLAIATATGGAYVRDGASPSLDRVIGMLRSVQ